MKLNSKLIINLSNNEEKNKSLLRFYKKKQILENINYAFKNINVRLKTSVKTNYNFSFINNKLNAIIFSKK